MANTFTDAWGVVTDTGTGSTPTVRASVSVEFHGAGEIDTGSTLTPTTTMITHNTPARPANPVR